MMHLNMRAFQKRVLKWCIRDNRGSPSFGSGWRFVSVWPQGPPKADSQRIHKAHKERKALESFQLKRCRLTLAREKRTRNCLRQFWKLFRVDPTSPPQRIVIPAYRQAGRAHFEVLPKFLESYSGRGIRDIEDASQYEDFSKKSSSMMHSFGLLVFENAFWIWSGLKVEDPSPICTIRKNIHSARDDDSWEWINQKERMQYMYHSMSS